MLFRAMLRYLCRFAFAGCHLFRCRAMLALPRLILAHRDGPDIQCRSPARYTRHLKALP